MSHGADGLRQVAEDAVLNANYVMARLEGRDDAGLRRPVHARGAVRRPLPQGHRRRTLDFAKAMIDEGFHPMTMYFPLVVHGALLIEPTESESKADLDLFIDACGRWPSARKAGDAGASRPRRGLRPRRRLDETARRAQAGAALAPVEQTARKAIR